MKSIKLKHTPALENINIKDAAFFFEKSGTFEYIDMLNWPEKYPYKPECKFKIARSTTSIFIHYKIIENGVRAIYTKDNSPVFEDSCVEFFCRRPDQKSYYNFEFNCIGTCMAGERNGRNEIVSQFNSEQMSTIKRHASLGTNPFNEIKANFEWKLTVEIPFTLLGITNNNLPDKLMANFYKCADALSTPHYLSWSLISTTEPNFHRPDFFAKIIFC